VYCLLSLIYFSVGLKLYVELFFFMLKIINLVEICVKNCYKASNIIKVLKTSEIFRNLKDVRKTSLTVNYWTAT
jgi:hypothetical protein